MLMPNFLIIGAQKAGTTSLYHYLKQHPQVYMSPVKEPHFYTYEGEKLNTHGPGRNLSIPITNLEVYQAMFQEVSDETAIGEASPSYIYSPKAPERIRHYIPNTKLIAILRHPAERAYSNFLHSIRYNCEPLNDFAQALQEEEVRIRDNWGFLWHYKQKGFYYVQLKRYFDLFDQEQIRVYLYEDLNTNPNRVLRDIFQFLSVDENFAPDISTKHNVSGIPKNRTLQAIGMSLNPILKSFLPVGLHRSIRNRILIKPPELPLEIRRQLIEVYREDILKLQALIQQDLSIWLK